VESALGFDPKNDWESAYQSAMLGLARYRQAQWDGYSDSLAIAWLATRCPDEYGKGVFQARAFMAYLTPGLSYADACVSGSRSTGSAALGALADEGGQILLASPPRLAPNPARSQAVFSAGRALEVEVFSSSGQFVTRFGHEPGETAVSLAGWSQGIYIFRYRTDKGDEMGSLRLVVE
jgi:hypothetical protein